MIIESYLHLACFLYSKYAEILAAQGCLETAMGYLMTVNDQVRTCVCSCTSYFKPTIQRILKTLLVCIVK